jgi:hypothetical protein
MPSIADVGAVTAASENSVRDEPGGFAGHIPIPDKISYGFGQFGEGLRASPLSRFCCSSIVR